MTRNMGTIDRTIRTILALGVAGLYFTGVIGGWLALVLGAFAVAFLLASAAGSCPMYGPLGISTRTG
jgi:hypothetical protein